MINIQFLNKNFRIIFEIAPKIFFPSQIEVCTRTNIFQKLECKFKFFFVSLDNFCEMAKSIIFCKAYLYMP